MLEAARSRRRRVSVLVHSASSLHERQGRAVLSNHANNNIAGRIIPFLVLGFWDKNAGIYAGAMPYRPVFFGHHQDLGMSSLKRRASYHQ